MPDKRDVFVSYSRANTAFARDLYAKLSALGFTLWHDRSDMEGGEDWWRQIQAAIENVDTMILVLSPKALESAVVAQEWHYARQKGTRVIPILAEAVNFDAVPRWMKRLDWLDLRPDAPELDATWHRLLTQLRTPYERRHVPFPEAEKLPPDFVARPGVFEPLLKALVDETHGAVAISAALRGAGGYGKTTLAKALIHDVRVRGAFDDGILWITLGENPENLLGKLQDLILQVTGAPSAHQTLEGAKNALAELLKDRYVLLVIDDVWNADHLKPFMVGGQHCAHLISTRYTETLPSEVGFRQPVDAMQPEEAAALLAYGFSEAAVNQNAQALKALAERLYCWAQPLKLGNGFLRDYGEAALAEGLRDLNELLDQAGISGLDGAALIEKVLEATFKRLKSDEVERFRDLRVFPEDVRVPLDAIQKLWRATGGLAPILCKRLLDRFEKLSLLLEYDHAAGMVRLHDAIRAAALAYKLTDLPSLHTKFLSAYGATHWADLPADEPYLWDYLAYHLLEANQRDGLRAALLDYRYLQAKLNARDTNALLSDCDTYLNGGADEPIRLVRSALSMSGHILAEDKRALSHQLAGRLMTHRRSYPEIVPLTEIVEPPSLVLRFLNSDYATHEQAGGAIIRTLRGHTGWVTAVAYAPDGACLVSASDDKTLIVWDAATGKALRALEGHTASVRAVAYAPDGARLVSASSDNTLIVWDAATGEKRQTLRGHTGWVTAVAYAPDGACLVSASEDNTLIVWDAATGKALRALEGHTASVRAVAYAPDGARLVSASEDNTLIVWDAATGEKRQTLRGHTGWVRAVAYAPDGARLVSASEDKTLIVWDAATGKALRALEGHTASVRAVAYAPDGARLVSASEDNTLIVWDAATGEKRQTLRGHTGWVRAVAYAPDGARLVSASSDNTLIVWDAATGEALHTLEGHTGWVTTVAYAPDGARLVSASSDNTLIVWDAATGEKSQTLRGHTGWVTTVAYAPDGARLVSASSDNTLIVWDATTGKALRALEGHTASVRAVAYAPDGARLVSASLDNTLIVWDAATGEKRQTLRGHTDWVTAVAYAPDGARLVSASRDNTLIVWDAATGEALHTLEGHTGWVTTVAYAPDGARLVSASSDNTLIVWDAATGEKRQTLRGHTDWVRAVAYAPDGARLVSASDDNMLIVWDATTGKALYTFYGDARFSCVAWSADGKHITAGDEAGRVLFLKWVG